MGGRKGNAERREEAGEGKEGDKSPAWPPQNLGSTGIYLTGPSLYAVFWLQAVPGYVTDDACFT